MPKRNQLRVEAWLQVTLRLALRLRGVPAGLLAVPLKGIRRANAEGQGHGKGKGKIKRSLQVVPSGRLHVRRKLTLPAWQRARLLERM